MAELSSADPDSGIDFPVLAGKVSTTAVGRAAAAAAAGAVDKREAARIAAVSNWRKDYVTPFRRLTEISARSPEAALAVSETGLGYLRDTMVFNRGGESIPVADLTAKEDPPIRGSLITGEQAPVTELVVPYAGKRLRGDELLRQLDRWAADGVVEPGFAEAIGLVARNPDWLELSDQTVVVLGAGSEMGPLFSLLRWGGRVVGVDLPRPEVWTRLIESARRTGGSLEIPVPLDCPASATDAELAASAGVNLISSTPEVLGWLRGIPGPLVLGNYLYADSGLHVRVSMAADALAAGLADREELTLAYLATPTDAFAVPWSDVERSRQNWSHRRTKLIQPPLHLLGQFNRNYQDTIVTEAGDELGIADCLVPQQGPNYVLAKRLQRWRAVVARTAGTRVSLNVAPATRTRSVMKNRALAAAYAGAHRFGIRVFDPSTANSLMAAMLVHDVRNPKAAANPATPLSNPMDLFSAAANHGGLWTTAYEPRSVLGMAAAMGMFEHRA